MDVLIDTYTKYKKKLFRDIQKRHMTLVTTQKKAKSVIFVSYFISLNFKGTL